ncbi:hypothetical protein Tco_1362889 [Tanacetum coccineum]
MGDENLIRYSRRLLQTLTTRATGLNHRSPRREKHGNHLRILQPIRLCKMDALPRTLVQDPNEHLQGFPLNCGLTCTLMVKIGKERALISCIFPSRSIYIWLERLQQDPSPYGRILLPDTCSILSPPEGPLNSRKIA